MVSQRMKQLGTARSVIRELFEYGNQRAAQVGRENVFDFSIGNPSVPPPPPVNRTAMRQLPNADPPPHPRDTSAQGVAAAPAQPVHHRGGCRGLVLRVPRLGLPGR